MKKDYNTVISMTKVMFRHLKKLHWNPSLIQPRYSGLTKAQNLVAKREFDNSTDKHAVKVVVIAHKRRLFISI